MFHKPNDTFLEVFLTLRGFPQHGHLPVLFPSSQVSKCLHTWTSFATFSIPNLFLSLVWVAAILLNIHSMPGLKGGHDAIDIIKVEKRTDATESHRPPNIQVDNVCFQQPVLSMPRIGLASCHFLLWVA